MTTLAAFLERCSLFCERHEVSRTWLSKELFTDTYKLAELESGKADVGVRRLQRADADLANLEAARKGEAA